MIKMILAGVISFVGGNTNLFSISDKPPSPSTYGTKQVVINGPGLICSYQERFTYSVNSVSSEIIYESTVTVKNTYASSRTYDFENIIIPGETFQVVSYSSVETNTLKLDAVKDLVNAENLAPSDYYDYWGVVLAPNQ